MRNDENTIRGSEAATVNLVGNFVDGGIYIYARQRGLDVKSAVLCYVYRYKREEGRCLGRRGPRQEINNPNPSSSYP
jgi:hypothetical protein